LKQSIHRKTHGVHYTPPDLATFLAEVVWPNVRPHSGRLRVLDPACGDGELLRALAAAAPPGMRKRLVLVGYETNSSELARAGITLQESGVAEVVLHPVDFLSLDHDLSDDKDLFSDAVSLQAEYQVVIANPPYVRTQVLGAAKAQALARRFELRGRVDLYHAFVKAMSAALCAGGTLGLLTSNRFLFVQSGAAMRQYLRRNFDLKAIFDLGDTKLFEAAVLPAILVAQKGVVPNGHCAFQRVYETRLQSECPARPRNFVSVVEALRNASADCIKTDKGLFRIERGVLASHVDSATPWSLQTPQRETWLETMRANQSCRFCDVGKVRVGIKTTADSVFIRDDWDSLSPERRPEPELLRPIITNDDDARWLLRPKPLGRRRVLYTHRTWEGRREPIPLGAYPRACAYLESHRKRLAGRRYVIEAGRQWYEIWVPQDPEEWANEKIVFPDIAEQPRFFLDKSGAIVDGDCYWITLCPGVDRRWLRIMLAVANSSFITAYYDMVFHNKLYSGRRRFMAQYVRKFPLPRLDSPATAQMLELVATLLHHGPSVTERSKLEADINDAVWQSFGLTKEGPR